MRTLAFLLALALPAVSPVSDSLGLPELHRIRTATLSPSYSCRSPEEFRSGYANTALFLSTYSICKNSPDLLFNGACGSTNYFQASTAGNDFGFIADLGEGLSVESISADQADNVRRIAAEQNYSIFRSEAPVKAGHTYAVFVAHSDRRALFFVTVTAHEPSKSVKLRYAVKLYEVFPKANPGFDWGRKSFE